MELKDKVIIVTGGAMGIGAAMCRRFAAEQPETIVVVDIIEDEARAVASEVGGIAFKADLTREADIVRIVAETEKRFGHIDLFCSNAGIISSDAPAWTAASVPNNVCQTSRDFLVMAPV